MSIHNKVPVQTEFVLRESNKRIKPLERQNSEKNSGTVVYPILSPIPPEQRNERYRVKKVSKSQLEEVKKRKPRYNRESAIKDENDTKENHEKDQDITVEMKNTDEQIVEVPAQTEAHFDLEETDATQDEGSSESVRVFESSTKNSNPWLGTSVSQRNL